MHLVWNALPLASLVLVIGCGEGPGPELLGIRRDAVVNGQAHSGHPSAGKLTTSNSLCTATLVGKKTVVTAAHCVNTYGSHTFTVGGTAYQATKAVRHPQYSSYSITNDIAIVILQTAPSVQPTPISTAAPSVGTEITIVGYGKTSEYQSDAGTKRMAKANIAEVTSTRIRIPQSTDSTMGNICNGDSGGPSYATLGGVEVVVGVHSTKSGACGSGGHDTRVDAFADWVAQASGGDVQKGGTGPPPPPPPPADAQPPTVSITYPYAGAKVGTSLTVKTESTDNKGVTKLEMLVDGNVVGTSDGKTLDFPVTLQPGNRQLKVVAHDAAGNKGEAMVMVIVETGATPEPPKPDPPPDNPPVDPDPAPAPGVFGSTCQTAADCQSGMCADDMTLGTRYCTQLCGPNLACPNGATCYQAEGDGDQVCGLDANAPPPGENGMDGDALLGSCSVSGDPSLGVLTALLLGLWLVLRRRARKRQTKAFLTSSSSCRS